MNIANGDVNMIEEQDENGPDEVEVPIVRTSSSDSDEHLQSCHSLENRSTDEHDENSKPKAVRQAPPIAIPTQTRLKLRVKRLHVVAEWKWAHGADDTCGICRMPFEACCVDCSMPGDGCPLVLGACKHPFHMHCIVKWTEAQNTTKPQCPLCRQEWKFQ